MATYPFKDFITTMSDGVKKALRISGYDEQDDMMKVKSNQKKWRAGFSGNTLSTMKWNVEKTGTGMSVQVVNGELRIITGTTANQETVIVSKESFTVPLRVMAHVALSQRIANQEFIVEIINDDADPQDNTTSHYAGWLFDGTSATQAKYFVNGGDQPVLTSSATTVSSTATAGSIFEIEPTADECWFFTRSADSTAGRAYSFVRHTQIPNPNLKYKFRITVRNLGTAPASSTTFSSQFVNINDYAELTAEITAGRGTAVAGQGIFATVAGSLSSVTTVYVSPKASPSSITTSAITTTTPFQQTAFDLGSTLLYNTYRFRATFSQPVTIEVQHGSSSTSTSNRVQSVYNIPANTPTIIDEKILARYISLKITNTGTATTTVHEVLGCPITL